MNTLQLQLQQQHFVLKKNEYITYNNKHNYNSNTREVTKQN